MGVTTSRRLLGCIGGSLAVLGLCAGNRVLRLRLHDRVRRLCAQAVSRGGRRGTRGKRERPHRDLRRLRLGDHRPRRRDLRRASGWTEASPTRVVCTTTTIERIEATLGPQDDRLVLPGASRLVPFGRSIVDLGAGNDYLSGESEDTAVEDGEGDDEVNLGGVMTGSSPGLGTTSSRGGPGDDTIRGGPGNTPDGGDDAMASPAATATTRCSAVPMATVSRASCRSQRRRRRDRPAATVTTRRPSGTRGTHRGGPGDDTSVPWRPPEPP